MAQSNARKFWIAGGAVAVIGVVGMIAADYPPGLMDTAGTIVPAKRFRADGGGSTILGDSSANSSGVAATNAAGVNAAGVNAAGVNAAGVNCGRRQRGRRQCGRRERGRRQCGRRQCGRRQRGRL